MKLGWKVKENEKEKKRIVDGDERRWYSKMNGKLGVMDKTSLKPCNVSRYMGYFDSGNHVRCIFVSLKDFKL